MNLYPPIYRRAFVALLLAWCSVLVGARELKSYKSKKLFIGGEGDAITIARLEPRNENQVFIMFNRVEGEWDFQCY